MLEAIRTDKDGRRELTMITQYLLDAAFEE